MEKEIKPMNLYEKLQKSRVELQKTSMKKSGKNTFSKYDYFELGDFLPQANEIASKNRMTPVFHYGSEEATLTIYDMDDIEKTILFSTPVASSELKGCSPMQSVGAMQTYARRYLYVMAFEISENYIVNNAEVDEDAELGKKKIDPIKAKVIKDLIIKSNTDEVSFLKWAKVKTVEDIINVNFALCVNMLERAVSEYEKANKKNELDGVI